MYYYITINSVFVNMNQVFAWRAIVALLNLNRLYVCLRIPEAGRVVTFRRISEEKAVMGEEKLRQLGDLMSKSHASLHKLYECSHPSVDALVDKAMTCGALGARLTGAG